MYDGRAYLGLDLQLFGQTTLGTTPKGDGQSKGVGNAGTELKLAGRRQGGADISQVVTKEVYTETDSKDIRGERLRRRFLSTLYKWKERSNQCRP